MLVAILLFDMNEENSNNPYQPTEPTSNQNPQPNTVDRSQTENPLLKTLLIIFAPFIWVRNRNREGGVFSFILTAVTAVILVQLVNTFFYQSYKVFGESMYPTLEQDNRLIIAKIGKTFARIKGRKFQPKRGEIVVFTDPQSPDIQLIKRVIGMPGERVVVKNEHITVYNKEHPNGFNPDDAPYGKVLPPTSGNTDITVPEGHIFVSGDNREGGNSLDSRNQLGTVPEELIVGTLTLRFFPFNTARFF